MSPKGLKWFFISLYVLYMVVIVFPPMEPSFYNAFIDTIEAGVTEVLCFTLVKYHDSIPMSNKTILNYLMKIIAITYGGIYLFDWITSLLFNIFPSTGLEFLQMFPSVSCFILSADIFHFTFFLNLILIIILHAGLTASPRFFLDMDDNYLKILVYGYNIIGLVVIFYGKWAASFCARSFIYRISKKLDLDSLENSLTVYEEGSKFTLFLCLFAASTVLISKLIVNMNKIKSCFVCKRDDNYAGAANGEDVITNITSNTQRNEEDSTKKMFHDSGYNLDAVGLYFLVTTFCFIIFVRLLMNLDLEEDYEKLVKAIYDWSNSALERSFGSSLPLYWLLRKEHSRAFVKRKIERFFQKYFNTGTCYTIFN